MNTILFDLDGTLLPMDMRKFEKLYFEGLAKVFSDVIEPKELVSLIWGCTKVMVGNTEHKTNEQVFMQDLESKIDRDLKFFQKRFDNFYETEFHITRKATKELASIKESIEILKDKGYRTVLATNPIFPQKATFTRIAWAGLVPSDFEYISTFEKNHYCKPQIEYYKEILRDINKRADECLMVGNDVQEDLIASKLGIKTYLITDNMLHRTEEEIFSDYKGTYDDFYAFVETLPRAL